MRQRLYYIIKKQNTIQPQENGVKERNYYSNDKVLYSPPYLYSIESRFTAYLLCKKALRTFYSAPSSPPRIAVEFRKNNFPKTFFVYSNFLCYFMDFKVVCRIDIRILVVWSCRGWIQTTPTQNPHISIQTIPWAVLTIRKSLIWNWRHHALGHWLTENDYKIKLLNFQRIN